MNNEVFGEANIVRCELLDAMPSVLDFVIKDMTHKLTDRVMCEVEKGELICSLQNVEQRQLYDLDSVEISRKVELKRLVRCKDCKHTKTDGCDAIYCEKWDYWEIPEDFYCAYGERRENA